MISWDDLEHWSRIAQARDLRDEQKALRKARRRRPKRPRHFMYEQPPAGVCCLICDRGPYRSRVAALPHVLRCRYSPLKRLGWHAACKTGYPVTRYGRSRLARFLARFDPNPGP